MPIKSVLKRYSGSEWVDVYLKTQSDVVYRTSGQTVESDLTNFLPGVTGTNSAPAQTSLGKLFTANDGSVYSSDVDGTPVQLASKQYVDDNKYVLPSVQQSDTSSSAMPNHGDTVTMIDSVVRDGNGRVTGVNLKTVTLPTVSDDISGNAATATKLANGAKIGLTGGATAEGINFDGSTDINLNVTALDPTKLSDEVAVEKGGTGVATLPQGQVLLGNGTDPITTREIDSTPTTDSDHLITSGAVAEALEGKSSNITGAASTVVSSDLTADRVVVSDGAGKLAASSITSDELGELSGVTDNVQTQIDAKAPIASPEFTGTPTAPTAAVGTDSTQVATTAYVIAAVNNLLNTKNAFRLVGSLDPTTQTLPAADAGDVYRITADGTINGLVVHENDTVTCHSDSTPAETPANWYVTHANHDGSVFGPSSSVDEHVVIFDGSSGTVIKDSGFTIGVSVPADAKFTDTVYTHPTSGVTAGMYPNPAGEVTALQYGSIINNLDSITVDANGHITAIAVRMCSLPAQPTDIKGNAATADALKTARTVTFSGGATGSFTFDGNSDVQCELTVDVAGGPSYIQSTSQPAAEAQVAGDFWEVPLS